MGDITKVREWIDSDEPEPEGGYDWPHPPICIESAVTGELRGRILDKLGRLGEGLRVRIIELEVEGGWSEFTIETDYYIEVWIDSDGREPEKVWERDTWSASDTMAAFLKWVG